MTPDVHLVECPRDAFQGLPRFIPTRQKVDHLLRIVAAGVREIDFGSFVSPKAVPQMADSEDVLRQFLAEVDADRMPRLIAIIANERGLERAAATGAGLTAGYPLSLAETFQRNNTGRSIDESWPLVENLRRGCERGGLDLVVYLSMAFGNPYGEPWSPQRVADFAARLVELGVRTISLADTVGRATPAQAGETFAAVVARAEQCGDGVTIGAHFHAAPDRWSETVRAAYDAGCRRFDAALGGLGGCPFAQDDLVGNIPTERVVDCFESAGIGTGIDRAALTAALQSARAIQQEFAHD